MNPIDLAKDKNMVDFKAYVKASLDQKVLDIFDSEPETEVEEEGSNKSDVEKNGAGAVSSTDEGTGSGAEGTDEDGGDADSGTNSETGTEDTAEED